MELYLTHSVLLQRDIYFIIMDDYKREERWDVLILFTQLIDIIYNGELRNDLSNSLTLDFKFQALEYDAYIFCLYRTHTHTHTRSINI